MSSFSFSARTILELGKELIGSDEVAIYELIKNGVDAKSPTIRINAHVTLSQINFQEAVDMLDGKVLTREKARATLTQIYEFIATRIPTNVSEAARSEFLSQIAAHLTDSAPEFRQSLKHAYESLNWITVEDDGSGMSLDELSNVFLRIGTRSRRADNAIGAQYLGDKGVGRLSTMRLGNKLSVRTTREGESRWHQLDIDWSLFSHEVDIDIDKIDITPRDSEEKADTTLSGTQIKITGLQAEWGIERFQDIFHGKIARMVDPFEQGAANKLLKVHHNTTRVVVPSAPRSLLDSSHARAVGSLSFDGDEPILSGKVSYERFNAERAIDQRGAEIYSLAQHSIKRRGKRGHAAFQSQPIREDAIKDLGPFDFEIYWFNRRVVEKVPGLTSTSTETREQVAQWAGGPMLYRYGFRVLPYGEPQDDWLQLDAVAFGLSGFKLNRQQVMGRVRVSSPHTALGEQTNRQGLMDSEAASALKTILQWVLHVELRSLINEIDEQERLSKRDAEDRALAFRETQDQVQDFVSELRNRVDPSVRSLVDQVATGVDRLADQCAGLVRGIDDAVKEVTDEREKFVYLAGIGLMTDFIFHELDRSVAHTLKLIADSQGAGRDTALKLLQDQLVTLQKRISAFDELTGEKRQSKSKFDLSDLISTVLQAHVSEFKRHSIKINFVPKHYPVKAVRGMIIQIVENLLSNSVYWLKQQSKYKPEFSPEIWLQINPEDHTLTVEDNGGGIAPERREVIFQPFVTSRPAGQGRGLGLYISRELAEYHDWQLYLDKEASRQRPGRLSVFVLDMG